MNILLKQTLFVLLCLFISLSRAHAEEAFDPTLFTPDATQAQIPESCKEVFAKEGPLRVGVVYFTNQSQGKVAVPEGWGWWKEAEVKISDVVTDHMMSELVSIGGARVYTRTEMEKVIQEHKLQMSGLVDDKTLIDFGKLAGLQYIITGSINNLGFTSNLIALLMGSVPAVEVQLSVRMIDIVTGEIVLSKDVTGKDILESGDYIGVISGIKKAITKGLTDIRPEFSKRFSVKGYILQTRTGPGGKKAAMINIGEKQGLKPGMALILYTFQEISDPFTKISICDKIKLPVEGVVTSQIQDNHTWILIDGDESQLRRVHPGCIVERSSMKGQGFFDKLGL